MSARIRVGIMALVVVKGSAPLAINSGREVRVVDDVGPCDSCDSQLWECEPTNGGPLQIELSFSPIGPIAFPCTRVAFHTHELIPLDGNLDSTDEGSGVDKPVDREVTA